MIGCLKGIVKEKSPQGIILEVGGVGYELLIPSNSLSGVPAEGEESSLYTYLHVREDVMQLYGFLTQEEKDLFINLISVTNVGPKVALSVLSAFSTSSLKKAIMTEDVDLIVGIPGIGKKSAQRLILELKEKLALPELEVASGHSTAIGSVYSEARKALKGLGYSTTEATKALEGFPHIDKEATAEEMVKYALRGLAGG